MSSANSSALLTSGAPSDFDGDQRGRIIGSCVAIFIITDLFVLLRLVSRKLARAGYWWDDVLVVLAMILANVLCIIWFCELRNGYGRHIYIWPLPERLEKERRWRRDFFVFELFFHTAITICKFSVLAFYFRIFPFRTFRNILLVVAGLSLGYGISIDVTILFQCRPLHYQWDILDPSAHGACVNFHDFFVGKGIANVLLNAVIFILPIPLLWRLRASLRQQIILASIFTLAGFVIIVSIVWIVVVPDVTSPDITWVSVDFGIWSTLEPNIAVICACIPSLHPLFTILRRGMFQHPIMQKSLKSTRLSTIMSLSSTKKHNGLSSTRSGTGSSFNRLDDSHAESDAEDMKPLGHEVEVGVGNGWAPPHTHNHSHSGQGNGAGNGGAMEVEEGQIGVQTDVVIERSARLTYNDRLY